MRAITAMIKEQNTKVFSLLIKLTILTWTERKIPRQLSWLLRLKVVLGVRRVTLKSTAMIIRKIFLVVWLSVHRIKKCYCFLCKNTWRPLHKKKQWHHAITRLPPVPWSIQGALGSVTGCIYDSKYIISELEKGDVNCICCMHGNLAITMVYLRFT